MAPGRRYDDACGMSHALDLIGERWALHVVRELLLGPKRYTDLHTDLIGISTNVLSARLDDLEQAGIVCRRRLPPPAASAVYELTDWGRALEPVICQLGRWAASSPHHDRTAHLSPVSLILSLRTNFDAAAAAGVQMELELRLGEEIFVARIADGRFCAERGSTSRSDAVVSGSPPAFAAVIYGGRPLDEAVKSGDVDVAGDTRAVERFFSAFVLPPAVPA